MPLLVVVILAVLALLIVAGPVLEDLIDRLTPPQRRAARHGRR
ncbi:hypothetical protein [Couchioplanes caeruleus]|nr:hypothetical protein [Couchioplanes caeruleus]